MPEKSPNHSYLSELISIARQKKGWATLKELYREKTPEVDYQSWLHAEAGRRIPHPKNLLEMGAILGIAKEDLIIAYCKDKFADGDCHQIVDSFLFKKFIDVDTLIEANQHTRISHTFTNKQIVAMKDDIRIRMYLSYTYDRNLNTTVSRLANFFGTSVDDARAMAERLHDLELIDLRGDDITRLHRHLDMPPTGDAFVLRKNLMTASLDQNIKPDSHLTNFHVNLSQDSLKKIMAFIYFAEANFLKLTKEDHVANVDPGTIVQIAIAVNKISEVVQDGRFE